MLRLIGAYNTISLTVIKANRFSIIGMRELLRLIGAYNKIPLTIYKESRYSIIRIRKC